MAKYIQPSDSKPEDKRLMPVLHSDKYEIGTCQNGRPALTVDEKKKFLEIYYQTGNATKAARIVGRDRMAFMHLLNRDPAFAQDFQNVRIAIKEDLEEVMTLNGLKEKGYMDRITWLRKNFPQEYNPNFDRGTDDRSADAIKELSKKLNDYDLIPKKKIINAEDENAV